MLRETLKDRADDVTVVSVLTKVLESPTLTVRESLSVCIFAMSLYGGDLAFSVASMVRDSLARKIMTSAQGPDGRAKLEEVTWLPRDLVEALVPREGSTASSSKSSLAALEMELKDQLDDLVMRRLQDLALERRNLQTPSLRYLASESTPYTTLVGRLCHVLSTTQEEDPAWEALNHDLEKVGTTLQQLSRAGFGLLATGIGRLGGMLKAGTTGAGSAAERPQVIIFVIGGATFQEVREVTEVARAIRAGGVRRKGVENFLLGSTAISTPDLMLDLALPPP